MIKKSTATIWARRLASLLAGCAILTAIPACAPVVIATGAVSGSMAATDRRTLGAQTEDKVIVLKGESAASNVAGENGHVNVTSFNRKVLLTGEVESEAVKQAVSNAISQIDNVQAIVNELVISAPTSFSSRSNDALITSKVAASLTTEEGVYSQAFKTVTENSVVFLMGRVTEAEGEKGAQVAAGVDGVTKVVKVFEYISQEELNRMSSVAAPSDSQQQTEGTTMDM